MAEFKLSPYAYTTGLYNNKLNQKFSELIKITHKYVYHAPSYAKYSTCKHLILLTWQLHDLIVECNYKKFKKTSLRIRKRSIKTFNNGLKYHDYDTIESVLAHAEHSASYNFFMKKLKPLHDFLPKHLKRRINKWQSIHSSPPMELMGMA